jgi:3-hydroxyisobutyrate dehydrogenase-like beta-hydroxyacid dehydrogenase
MGWHEMVGVIGLGAMGGAVGRRLVRQGIPTLGFDIDEAALSRAAANGIRPSSAAEAASCGVLITSLPTEQSVDELLTGELLGHLAGGVLIELSTVTPAAVRRVHQVARQADVAVIDCPVSGGPDNADAGTLVCFAGAAAADLERVRPLLGLLGTVSHVGAVGDGKVVKLVNNAMSIGNLVVAAEAFALGVQLGMTPTQLFDVLSRSGARSQIFLKKMPAAMERNFTPGFALRLAEKDIGLALRTASDIDATLPVAEAVSAVLKRAAQAGLGEDDLVGVIRLFEAGSQ